MTIEEAKALFNVNNIQLLNEAELKKKYRKLIKAYHPDVLGDTSGGLEGWVYKINTANMLLKDAMQVLHIGKEDKPRNLELSIYELNELLENGEVSLKSGLVNKKDISNYTKVEIVIPVDFVTVNSKETKEYRVLYNNKNVYHVEYKYTSSDEMLQVIIKCGGNEKTLSFKSNHVEIPIRFSSGVSIYIDIKKISG